MRKILTLLLLALAMAASAEETVAVYHLTGAIQCLDGTGTPLEDAADLLRGQGISVMGSERRTLPVDVPTSCGAPSGEANLITVSAADWSAFTVKNADAGGYGLWLFDESNVQVFKYDGTLQCGAGHEIPLEEMAKELETAGVEVLENRKGTDGLAHIAVCGASTGNINVYTIGRENLPAARKLGYRLLVTREMTEQVKTPVSITSMVDMQADPVPEETEKAPEPIPLLW